MLVDLTTRVANEKRSCDCLGRGIGVETGPKNWSYGKARGSTSISIVPHAWIIICNCHQQADPISDAGAIRGSMCVQRHRGRQFGGAAGASRGGWWGPVFRDDALSVMRFMQVAAEGG